MNRLYIKLSKTKFIKLEKTRGHKYIRKIPDGKGGWIYFYEKTIQDKFKEDRREFGDKNALKIMQEIIKTRNEEIEHSSFYDKKGNQIFKKTGTKNNVIYTDEEIKIIYGSRLTIHNHEQGTSFSSKDLIFLLKTNIIEMRVFGTNKNLELKNFYIKKTSKATDEIIKNFSKNLLEDIILKSSQLKQQAVFYNISQEQIELKIEKYTYLKFNEYNKGYYEHGRY